MTKVLLQYKGSSSSGNRMHAGRPGKIGGSMARNFGAAQASLAIIQAGNFPGHWANNLDPTTLNRAGLQAIIDYQQGIITMAQAQAIITAPSSQKGATPPAAAPAAPVTPPAPATPPAGTVVLKPPYVPTQADITTAQVTLTALQDPNDPRGAVHSSWATSFDPNNLTPDQIKILNIYAGGGMRGVTLKNAMLNPRPAGAAAPQATAPVTPPPPPPPPPKDPRFYQGDVKGKSAEEIFNGSSKEVQDLALKTGIVATDQATLDYLKMNGTKFERPVPPVKYLATYDNYIRRPEMDYRESARNQAQVFEPTSTTSSWAVSPVDNPIAVVGRLKSETGLNAAERALAEKLDDIRRRGDDAYSASYKGMGWSRAGEERFQVLKSGWQGLTQAEKDKAVELHQRQMVMDWVNGSVGHTMPGGTKTYNSPNFQHITIDKVPSAVKTAEEVKRFGWEYRGTMVKGQKPAPVQSNTAYTAKEVVALSKLDAKREAEVKAKFDADWDHAAHTFGGRVDNAFQIHPQKPVLDKYEAARTTRDNEYSDLLYHGTHYGVAVPISGNGYIVPKAHKAGRAMGDGVYLADKSSKSAQYIFSSGWGSSRNGVLFLNRVSRGNEVKLNSTAYYSGKYDTVFGDKRDWKNNEWAVKDPGAVLPEIWLDISTF